MNLAGPLNTNKKYTTSKLTDLEDPVKKNPFIMSRNSKKYLPAMLCQLNN